MNVPLSPQLEEIVQSKVASGVYGSASEVISDALWLLEERDRIHEMRLKQLRADISVGLEQATQGHLVAFDAESIKCEGRKRLPQRHDTHGAD